MERRSEEEWVQAMDDQHARVCADQRELFRLIAQADRAESWLDWGARDMAHVLWMRYGISDWKARRWIAAAHALEDLPRISEAFASGELGIDKVVELTRFATPDTEEGLIRWAQGVSPAAIRHKGDVALRQSNEEVAAGEKTRSVSWWFYDDNRWFGAEVRLPAAQGAVVAKGLERYAEQLPVMPGEEQEWCAEARLADALVALCSARIARDPDPDRATVVVHAQLDTLASGEGGCAIESGGVIPAQAAQRLLCNGRIQLVLEDDGGLPVYLGRITREPPDWMMRQLRYRDKECRFPGCGARRWTQAHHIKWRKLGGPHELGNLLLLCWFHHRLVHEHGWSVRRERDGTASWFHPDGTRYRAGPAPPDQVVERQPVLSAASF